MIDDRRRTAVDIRRMGRSASGTEPDRPLVELFPHLREAAALRIDRHGDVSRRLKTVLDHWHGRTWGPYLAETARAVRMRRGAGFRTVGELLELAVREADRRPSGSSAMRPAQPATTFDRLHAILEDLIHEERVIAEHRSLTLGRVASFEELGATLGRNHDDIRRSEADLLVDLADGLDADPGCAWLSRTLASELGAAWRVDRLGELEILADPRLCDVDRLETRLLLRSIGRYEIRDGWLIRRPADQLVDASLRPVRRARWNGPLSPAKAAETLAFLGIRPAMALAWTEYLDGIATAQPGA